MVKGRPLWTAILLTGLALGVDTAAAQDAPRTAGDPLTAKRRFCEETLAGELWSRTELYFGLSRSDGPDITEEAFQAFVDSVVTPRFPDGLTLLTGNGQFRGADGAVVQEGSKLLILFYPWSRSRNRAIETIRAQYKQDFEQQSVLRVDDTSCVSF